MVERDSRKPPPRPHNRVYPPGNPLSSALVQSPLVRPPFTSSPSRNAQSIRTQIDCRIIIENTRAAGSRRFFFLPRSVLCLADIRLTLWALPICRSKYRCVIWSFSRAIAPFRSISHVRVRPRAHWPAINGHSCIFRMIFRCAFLVSSNFAIELISSTDMYIVLLSHNNFQIKWK